VVEVLIKHAQGNFNQPWSLAEQDIVKTSYKFYYASHRTLNIEHKLLTLSLAKNLALVVGLTLKDAQPAPSWTVMCH
jgi:hypothetical protein